MRKSVLTKECENCRTEFETIEPRKRFCGRSCAAQKNNIQRGGYKSKACTYTECSNKIQNADNRRFCSIDCRFKHLTWIWWHEDWQPPSKEFPRWLRDWLVSGGCEVCEWNEINPFSGLPQCQIDHINGDRTNNRRSNIRVLCPNHHSLTHTFGALNRGRQIKLDT